METSLDHFIETPVFKPTEEQFKNGPVSYIHNISLEHPDLACCIIIPPQSFNPYFSLDQDLFKFKAIKQDFLTKTDDLSEKEFTFREYHRMGDTFKSDYFGKPPNMVTLDEIDENFWSLVTQGEDVQIVSAQCLSTMVHGSGFPNRLSNNILTKEDEKYLDHPWNLNNIFDSDDNVLNFVGPQLKLSIYPTIDIGMCFSHRGWRRDIHWTYSINYLHCGDSKLWYTISPSYSNFFGSKVKSGLSPLPNDVQSFIKPSNSSIDGLEFTSQEDKIKIFKAELQPGQFLVTFPSTYYMTYDTGVNVVESITFGPVSWLSYGYQAVNYLCDNNLEPIFSHEELISKMACDAEFLEIETVKSVYDNFQSIVEHELIVRKLVEDLPITNQQRQAFELISEEKRRCIHCSYVVFFSALTCSCDKRRFVCLKHINNLCQKCQPSERIYRFRYNKDEFNELLKGLKKRLDNFEIWQKKVNSILHNDDLKASIISLRSLLTEAEEKFYPDKCKEFIELNSSIQEFEQVDKIVQEILDQQSKFTEEENFKRVKYQSSFVQSSPRIKKKMESEKEENKNSTNQLKVKNLLTKNNEPDGENRKLTLSEFASFCEVLETYPFEIPRIVELKELLSKCNQLTKAIDEVLFSSKNERIDSKKLENIITDAHSLSFVSLEHKLEALKDRLEEVRWLEDCSSVLEHDETKEIGTLHDLAELKNLIESGISLKSPSNEITSHLNRLNMIHEEASKWLENSKSFLNAVKSRDFNDSDGRPTIEAIDRLVSQAHENPGLRVIDLNPNLTSLEDLLSKCQTWLKKADSLMISLRVEGVTKEEEEEEIPWASQLEDLYNQGKGIGCHFEIIRAMGSALESVNSWKDKVNKTFLRKNSLYQIVNVLAPRSNYSLPSSIDIMNCSSRSIYQQLRKYCSHNPVREGSKKLTGFEKQIGVDMKSEKINQVYLQAEKEEEVEVRIIREKNITKNNTIAANDCSLGDDDSTEKEGKKDKEKHSKKFCFCGKPASEWMAQCQVCQEWFHMTCVPTYLPFVNMVNKGRSKISVPNSDEIPDQYNFVCVLCCRGKRPSLDYIQDLIYSYSKLPTRALEGELLICLSQRVERYQEKVKGEILKRPDLQKGYEFAEQSFCSSEPSSQEASIIDSPSKNKRKSPLILRREIADDPGFNLADESRELLWDLICEGNLLEANIPELQTLWTTLLLINPTLKTMVYINQGLASLSLLASNVSRIGTNKRSPEREENVDEENADVDPSRSRMKRRKRDRSVFDKSVRRKGRRAKNDKDNVVNIEPELCSLNDSCLRPEGTEVDWIFCEGSCQRWFHQLCAGISSEEAAHIEKYYCKTCRSGNNESNGSFTNEDNSNSISNIEATCGNSRNQSGAKSKTRLKLEEIMEQDDTASADEGSQSPKTANKNTFSSKKMRRDHEERIEIKTCNQPEFTHDENAVEMKPEANDEITASICYPSISKVEVLDDEETASCPSEDRMFDEHNTSFESIEENVTLNCENSGKQSSQASMLESVHVIISEEHSSPIRDLNSEGEVIIFTEDQEQEEANSAKEEEFDELEEEKIADEESKNQEDSELQVSDEATSTSPKVIVVQIPIDESTKELSTVSESSTSSEVP